MATGAARIEITSYNDLKGIAPEGATHWQWGKTSQRFRAAENKYYSIDPLTKPVSIGPNIPIMYLRFYSYDDKTRMYEVVAGSSQGIEDVMLVRQNAEGFLGTDPTLFDKETTSEDDVTVQHRKMDLAERRESNAQANYFMNAMMQTQTQTNERLEREIESLRVQLSERGNANFFDMLMSEHGSRAITGLSAIIPAISESIGRAAGTFLNTVTGMAANAAANKQRQEPLDVNSTTTDPAKKLPK